MKKVVAVYTGQGLAEPLKSIFDEQLPEVKLVNIIDDSIISEVVSEGEISASVKKRLFQYYQSAVDMGADIILNTCSSVGEVADLARPFIDIPIVKIDEAMAIEAVENYETIGVIATLPSTLDPTMRLIERQAELLQKNVRIIDALAKGAYDALVGGNPKIHDQIILKTAISVSSEVDVLVLAQGSMARMENLLREQTGVPVLSSPSRGVSEIKSLLGESVYADRK
ncbi:Asp/Glu/hydantoin racemase [Mesobacillus foraminis]|uniref:aspartate/glutamate racemase family protein n=1 Tax=Mesobacillus foraminis TaxID=279826 RepID=UPI001BE7BA38|nr:aspartate/glutamate racemase family protein [Mesobacillus foraminis]MBT2757804.1 Asp/Glu/hydantoin racemase [Mesobacillus foraminis]